MRVSGRKRRKTPKAAALEDESDEDLDLKTTKEEGEDLSESYCVDETSFESDSFGNKFEIVEKMAPNETEETSNSETARKNEVHEVMSETVMSFDIKLFERPQVVINRLVEKKAQIDQPSNNGANDNNRRVEDVRARLDLPACIQLSINRSNNTSNKIDKPLESGGGFARIQRKTISLSPPKRKASVQEPKKALQIFHESTRLSEQRQKVDERVLTVESVPEDVEFVDPAQIEVDQNEPNSTENSEQQLVIKPCRLDQVEKKSLGGPDETPVQKKTFMETNEGVPKMKVPNIANLLETTKGEEKEVVCPAVCTDQHSKMKPLHSNQQKKAEVKKQSNSKKPPKPRKRKYGMLEEQVKEKLRQAFIKSQPYKEEDIAGCSVCNVKFLSSVIRDHHKCTGKCEHERYQCNICLAYVTPHRFIYHMDSHRQKLDLSGSVTCPICQLVIKDKRMLNDHFQQAHNRYEEGVCLVCTKVMPIEELKVHVRKHHYENQVMCPVCGACFRFPCLLKLHLSKHDSTQTSLVCEHCGKVYINSERLHVHIKTTHSKLQFPCEHCGKVFKTAATLARHVRVHMREKAFSCPLCDYGASRKDTVKAHSKRVHNYDMPNSEVISNLPESAPNTEESGRLEDVNESNPTTVVVIDSAANDGVERTTEFQVHNNGLVTEAQS